MSRTKREKASGTVPAAMLPILHLPVGAYVTNAWRIKYLVVPFKNKSCDLVILAGDETVNELALDAAKNDLNGKGINFLDMDFSETSSPSQQDVRGHVLNHLEGRSIKDYFVSQLNITALSAEELSSHARSLSSSGHEYGFFAIALEVRKHSDGVFEF